LAMRVAQAAGAEVRYLLTRGGRPAGVLVQWLRDEPGVLRGTIKGFIVDDVQLQFFIENDQDAVQGCHRRGQIYEAEELAIIRRAYAGGIFVDVGANVGNHAIFAVKILRAAQVIAFEPDPLAAAIFEINAALNGCAENVTLSKVAVSDRSGHARIVREKDNLGGSRIEDKPQGPVDVVRGDDVIRAQQVGFIKIDTEGSELTVLAGLRGTIDRCRPPLFVEVTNENIGAFKDFCIDCGYVIAEEFRRYQVCTNFLAVPAQRS
jgi:FkbM family methyltransferase